MNNYDLQVDTNNHHSDISYSNASGERPKWIQKIEDFTNKFEKATEYGATKEGVGLYERNKDPKGKRVSKFGLDPLMFVTLSFGLIVATSIAIVVIGKKQG